MSNRMVFDFEKMDIDKLNLANLVGKVNEEIMEYQIFAKVSSKI